MNRRAVRIVEVKIEGHSLIDGVFHLFRGRNASEMKLDGPECGSCDGQEKGALFRTSRADQQDFGSAKMCQSEASKGKGFFQRGCWQINAAQELSGRENIGMVAGDKFNHGYFTAISTARPKRTNAFQRRGEGNHRACRERHADIPAHRGFIPDLEDARKERQHFRKRGAAVQSDGALSTN